MSADITAHSHSPFFLAMASRCAGAHPFYRNGTSQAAAKIAEYREAGDLGHAWGTCCLNPDNEPFYSPTL